MKQDAKINIQHVPYKGAPEATTAVIRNDVQMYMAPIPSTQELSGNGQGQGARHQFRQARSAIA